MKDTVKIMLESDFGCDIDTSCGNRQVLENTQIVSENVRQLTGYTPDKVIVLSDGNNVFIEFSNNLERFMEDAGLDFREALDLVMIENNLAASDANIIIDESMINKINLDSIVKEVGEDHIFKK